MLDLGCEFRCREGGGGLVTGERRTVVARERLQVADPRVQHDLVGVAERERRAVVIERLGIRVEVARPISGNAIKVSRLDLVAGQREVVRDRGRL